MQDGEVTGLERLKVVAAFAAIYIVWGSTYLAIKVAVETIPPLEAAGVRFLIAGIILYSWARLRGAPKPSPSQRNHLAALGVLMFVPGYAAVFWAERTVPSGVTAVLVATLPFWTLLFEAALLKRRRVTPALAIALATGFVGVLLLTTGVGVPGEGVAWLPCAAVIVGEVFWAVGSVLTTRLDIPASSAITSGAEMICGGALLLVWSAAIGEWHGVPRLTAGAAAAMAYMVLAGSIVAYNAYVWLLGRTSATRLSSYTYVNPVVALAIGYQFAGERLTRHAVSGSLLVLVSVVLVQWAGRGAAKTRGGQGAEKVGATAAGHPGLDVALPAETPGAAH
jgi:drug/metabolite transporter (DMT)-like permease